MAIQWKRHNTEHRDPTKLHHAFIDDAARPACKITLKITNYENIAVPAEDKACPECVQFIAAGPRRPTCHPDRKYCAKGLCASCYTRTWVKRQSAPVAAARIMCARRSNLKRNYGLLYEEYTAMIAAQNGLCKICDKPDPTGRQLSVDHNHATNHIRGLLCSGCNHGIGQFMEDPTRLRRAIDYLLSAKKEWLEQTQAEYGGIPDNGYVTLHISDFLKMPLGEYDA